MGEWRRDATPTPSKGNVGPLRVGPLPGKSTDISWTTLMASGQRESQLVAGHPEHLPVPVHAFGSHPGPPGASSVGRYRYLDGPCSALYHALAVLGEVRGEGGDETLAQLVS